MSRKVSTWFVPVKAGEAKAPYYYPTDDMILEAKVKKHHKACKKSAAKAPKGSLEALKASLVPGKIVIILAGKYAGKKVVFLKQCEKTGSLICTGPYKVNGVPLLRINQRYVIVTSQQIDVSGAKLDGVDAAFFKKITVRKTAFGKEISAEEHAKEVAEKKALLVEKQKQVDETLLAEIKKVPYLRAYMKAYFGIKKGQYPHLMKF